MILTIPLLMKPFLKHIREDFHHYRDSMYMFCAREEFHVHEHVKRCSSMNTLYKSAVRMASLEQSDQSNNAWGAKYLYKVVVAYVAKIHNKSVPMHQN